MLKQQNPLKCLKKRMSFSLSLAKSINHKYNLPEVLSKAPLIARPKKISPHSFYAKLCSIRLCEAAVQENGDSFGVFEIGPLEAGHGVTLGSTLRRAILGAITGSAITGFTINEASHEFSVVGNIKEDMLDVASNLKALRINCESPQDSILGQAWITGPKIITGGMLQFPHNTATILNPNQYICTVTAGIARIDVEVSSGAGYEKVLDQKKEATLAWTNYANETELAKPNLLPINANFSPIKNVSYKVKLGHDMHGTISDIVEFTVVTNGTYSPRRALLDGAKEILELFYPLIIDPKLERATVKLREVESVQKHF